MTSGYTQDVVFNSGFGALQTPIHMFTAAVLCGFGAPPVHLPFRFLDLACGNGLTLALLADAYPHAEFVGVDINPAHIRDAEGRAAEAGLDNVRFIEGDIRSLRARDFDRFDYCALGGLYSWLDEERRHAARRFVADVVRPGGVFYVDYSAQPGIAQTAALYRVLQKIGPAEGNSAERLSAATALLDRMRRNGAQFFAQQPIAANRLKSILQNPPEDEAHEVLNFQDHGLWSTEVIEDFTESGFDFAGNCGLHHNLPELTPNAKLLGGLGDRPPAMRELLFDVAWNVAQRKDLYVRRGDAEARPFADQIADLPIYTMTGAMDAGRRGAIAKKFPNSEIVSPLADAVETCLEEADTFGALFEALGARGFAQSDVEAALKRLIALNLVSVAIEQPASPVASGSFTMPSRLNQTLLKEDLSKQHARPLASPVAGSRVLLPLKDRLYLTVCLGKRPGKAWRLLGDLRSLFRGDQGEELTEDAFAQTVRATLPNFGRLAVPELVRLKILVPTE